MTRLRAYRDGLQRILLLCAALLLTAMPQPAHAACNALGQFSNLVIEAQSLKRSTKARTDMNRLRSLRDMAERLKTQQMQAEFADIGRSREFGKAQNFLRALVTAAEAYTDAGEVAARTAIYSPSFQNSLSSMSNLVEGACDGPDMQSNSGASVPGPTTFVPAGASGPQIALRLLPVFLILLACIVIVAVTHIIVLYIRALQVHQRSCSIDATMEMEGKSFEGSVTILGREGLEFRIDPELGSDKIAIGQSAIVTTADRKLEGKIGGKEGEFLGLWFQHDLTKPAVEKILAISKTPPRAITSLSKPIWE